MTPTQISVLKIIFKVRRSKGIFFFTIEQFFLSLPGYEMPCPSWIHLAKDSLLLGTHHHSKMQVKTPMSNQDLSGMLS
jgi:hypothetical protein